MTHVEHITAVFYGWLLGVATVVTLSYLIRKMMGL